MSGANITKVETRKFYVYFKDGTECMVEATDFSLDGSVARFFNENWAIEVAFHGVKGVSISPLTFTASSEVGEEPGES